jgi:hypothetical protein
MHAMTPDQTKRLEGMSQKGRTVWFKNKSKPGHQEIGKVVDEVYIMVSDYKHMIQKIEFKDGASYDGSKFGYRTCYYTYDGQKNCFQKQKRKAGFFISQENLGTPYRGNRG